MPYNIDRARLDAMLPYLAPLAQGVASAKWQVVRGSPNTVAYRIREALLIARSFPDEYPDLARYAGDYSISVVDGNHVQAKRKGPLIVHTGSAALSTTEPVAGPLGVVDLSALRRPPLTISAPFSGIGGAELVGGFSTDGPQSPESIITLWEKGGSVKRTLYFPSPRLTSRQFAELWLWACSVTPKVMLMVNEAEESVTVAQYDPQVAEFAWRPSDKIIDEIKGEEEDRK